LRTAVAVGLLVMFLAAGCDGSGADEPDPTGPETPPIVIESPRPGDRVTSPIPVRGTANVFEATVSFEVLNDAGDVVLSTFTTATSGTGTRGTFETELSVPKLEGPATIVAFEASAKDGSPLHVVRVPVVVG
jgi:hypothetical protein